jgi:hypothetical protein
LEKTSLEEPINEVAINYQAIANDNIALPQIMKGFK